MGTDFNLQTSFSFITALIINRPYVDRAKTNEKNTNFNN